MGNEEATGEEVGEGPSYDRCELLCLDLRVAERLRKKRLAPEDADAAAGKARALSDPARLMLAAAARSERAMRL
jgi:hypothetical protein